MFLVIVVLGVSLALLWSQPRLGQPQVPPNAMRVLFVGNSHTQNNDVPGMVARLAGAAGVERPLHAVTEAPGGAGFVEHLGNGRVAAYLREEPWDYVVLQDQQQRRRSCSTRHGQTPGSTLPQGGWMP